MPESKLKNRKEPSSKPVKDLKSSESNPPKLSKHDKIKALLEQYPRYRSTASPHASSLLESDEWGNGTFYGFYVLFWVVIGVFVVRILILNLLTTGKLLGYNVLSIIGRNIYHVALTDLVMYFAMYPTFIMQWLSAKDIIDWDAWGWLFQHAYQALFLAYFLLYAHFQHFTWLAQIFLTLHALVQLMKMHSYAVYNGHMKRLSLVLKEFHPENEEDEKLKENLTEYLGVYPNNITLKDFFMYTMFPTCVYETAYPRTTHIRWGYAARQIAATLGIFTCMIIISQQMMHPVASRANYLRETISFWERVKLYPLIFLEVYPGFMLLYVLTFYLIWHSTLNAIAELSMYGDREFYRDWWNSTNWAKFARDWNVPVHNFLQRHAYSSSRWFLKLSKTQAMFFTFFLSSIIHELAMWVIFGRLRGYLLGMQLCQVPMQYMCQSKFMRDRPNLALVFFWIGIATGPSILCSLYLTF